VTSSAFRLRYPLLATALASFGAFIAVFLLSTAAAPAAVTHEFLPELSAKISKGVPAGCGESEPEPPCIAGPLGRVSALAADSGHLWAAEALSNGSESSRVDRFDASSGEFSPPQLNEENEVQFLELGVAVAHLNGEEQVYVGASQKGKNVVAVFGPPGGLQGVWTGASTPGETFGIIQGVAVDGSANPETQGEVYVASQPGVVNVFQPEAGGKEPGKAAGQIKGPETPCVAGQAACVNPLTFAPCKKEGELEEGESETGCVFLFQPTGVAVSAFNGDVLVADGNAEQCVNGEAECGVDVFEPAGLPGTYSFLFRITGTPQGLLKRIGPIAVDGADGEIYVAEKQSNVVDEFNAEGQYLGRLTGTPTGPSGETLPFRSVRSVAVDAASRRVFVGDVDVEKQLGSVDVFGEDLVIPDVETLSPSSVTAQGAVLNGTVNPRGAGAASCQFAWGESEAFGHLASCPTVPNGEAAAPVSATLKELAPDTTYFYRLQAGNEVGGLNPGESSQNQSFTTLGPGIRAQWASEVSSTSATLNAQVNPHGKSTEYFFQYGPNVEYALKVPTTPLSIGSGEANVHARQHVQGLNPGTIYHYRVVAVTVVEVEGVATRVEFPGPDRTFTAQGASGVSLPDERQWQLVSPGDKHGATLLPIEFGGIIQSSASGGALTYIANPGPTEDGAHGSSEGVQVLSTHDGGGWSSTDISTPHAAPVGTNTQNGSEYRFFSEDLSLGLVEPFAAEGAFTSLSPEAFPPDTERTPYLRHNTTCPTERARCYEPLLTGAPGFADVPEGTTFGGDPTGRVGAGNFLGATPALAHVILSSKVALSATPTSGQRELYEWSPSGATGEELRLVSVLPHNGGPAPKEPGLGYNDQVTKHAISGDGSRIVWSEVGGALYVRDTVKDQTVQLDAPEAECLSKGECGSGQPSSEFQLASEDQSRILFTDTRRLTKDSGGFPGQPDLYECLMVEVAGELQCRLSDLTPIASGANAAVRGGMLGASEDASYVYFIANGVLGDGVASGAERGDCASAEPTASQTCNLYLLHYDGARQAWEAPRFIKALSGEDHPDWGQSLSTNGQTARVSPDGHWLALMSSRPLTGYDNQDTSSGQPDEEVFRFHVDDGALVCASCDPTGARPVGAEYQQLKLVAGENVWEPHAWLAANVPAWTPYEGGHARYQSRYLSDSGRLFFNSLDALVSQDINGNQDVYESEPVGVGDCTRSSATFSAGAGSCVALISSGTAAGESAFLDASEDGGDVFFLTGEKLVSPPDVDTALDVYDAHVCTSASPCPGSTAAPPPCTTADACRPAPSPQPSIFGSPASSTFSGASNVSNPPPKPPAALTRVQKLTNALSACRKKYKKAKRRRGSCERQAHKRYGLKQPRKATAKRGGRR
jgi:hypothetical protein